MEEMKKKDEKEKMEANASAQGGANDSERGRRCWAFEQNHEANTMEEWSTDPGERRRGCEVVETVVKQR